MELLQPPITASDITEVLAKRSSQNSSSNLLFLG